MKKKTKKIIVISLAVLAGVIFTFSKAKDISPLSWGIHNEVNQAIFSDEAINGYDPVAYFTDQKAVKGNRLYSHEWKEASWYFVSDENLDLFKNNPEKYAPQFGGYCAFAVSKGFTANIDPEAFTIRDGRLYLFSEPKFRDEWLADGETSVVKSRQNWE